MYPPGTPVTPRKRRLSNGKIRKVVRQRKVRMKKMKKLSYNKNKSLSGGKLVRKVIDKYEKFGVHCKWELVGAVESQETATPSYNQTQFVMLGHTSMPVDQVLVVVCNAICKAMSIRLGAPISDFTQSSGTAAGDLWNLRWQASPSAAVTTTPLGVPATAPWSQVSSLLQGILFSIVNEEAELLSLDFVPAAASTTNYTLLDLVNCKIYLKAKSVLKIQNVSLPNDAGDDTADEVTAVALNGKTFVGKGAGTAVIRPKTPFTTDVGLWGDTATGIISRRYALDTQVLREVPRAEELINVKKSGPIVMGPGVIQQSVLYDYYGGYINYFFKLIRDSRSSAGTVQKSLGKFALHAVEKIIETTVATGIQLNYQLDNEYSSYVKGFTAFPTTATVYLNGTQQQ